GRLGLHRSVPPRRDRPAGRASSYHSLALARPTIPPPPPGGGQARPNLRQRDRGDRPTAGDGRARPRRGADPGRGPLTGGVLAASRRPVAVLGPVADPAPGQPATTR